MIELIALRAVFGQDEANHGTARYRVDAEGLVHVPPEAVDFLISKGGFVLPKTSGAATAQPEPIDAKPDGLVRLHHGDAAGCSYAGRQYPSDENGDVLVPAPAAADLMAHGFVPAPEDGLPYRPGPAAKPAAVGKPAPGAMPKPALREARG
ncbi:MAG TPA: hypothetical protein VGM07_10870 [Stellaceae bacterium]|jgi:hypothetical protein